MPAKPGLCRAVAELEIPPIQCLSAQETIAEPLLERWRFDLIRWSKIRMTAMRIAKTIALAAVATALPVSASMAADLITIPTSTQAELPIVEDVGFDWNGFYAGVHAGAQNGAISDTQYGLGVQAGVNAQFDFYLLGAEVAVTGLAANGTVGETTYGQILGRAGLVVSDNVMVYAAGGYGIDLGVPAEEDVLAGGGVELAVTDNISVRAQYLHGFPMQGGNDKDQFTVGASYHF